MEVGNFDQAELDKAVAAFLVAATKYVNALDKSDMTRQRQLFVEGLLNGITAMHESVSIMSLLIIQSQDYGHRQGREAVFKQIELARQSQTKGGIMVPIKPLPEAQVVYERNEADRPAALRLSEARADQLREQYNSHMPTDDAVAGADDTAKYATFGIAPNKVTDVTGKLTAAELSAGLKNSVAVENCDCDGASLGCSGACKTVNLDSKLGTDPLVKAIRQPITLSSTQERIFNRAEFLEKNRIHELKIWPEYFAPVQTGNKNFEVRENDRDFKVGDTVHLLEWDQVTEKYTGYYAIRVITYILALSGSNLLVLAIRTPERAKQILSSEAQQPG